jgi:hypothetical protein
VDVHEWLAASAIKRGGGTVGRPGLGPGNDVHHYQYLEKYWTQGGRRCRRDAVANQPRAAQESTGDDEDEEADDFILYQVEEEREAPATLLQHNFYNEDDKQPFVVDLPEEEWQQAPDFHNGDGYTAV